MNQHTNERGTWELYAQFDTWDEGNKVVVRSGRVCALRHSFYTPDPAHPNTKLSNWSVWVRLEPGEDRLPRAKIEQRLREKEMDR